MTRGAFLGWGVAAVITVTAAIVSIVIQPGVATAPRDHRPAFPPLRDQPEAVARIEVRTPARTIALERAADGSGWGVADRSGYPADAERVQSLVASLAEMHLIEPKTAQPDRHDRLGVEDLDNEDARSRVVRLLDVDGEALAEAIIGRASGRVAGFSQGGIYMRFPEDPQSWLASGSVDLAEDPADWLDRSLIDLRRDEVRRVEVMPADGEAFAARRTSPGDDLELVDPPADRSVDEAAVSRLAAALSAVRLEDVRPRDAIDLPTERSRAIVTTFDGVEVAVELAEIDGDHWALLEARAVDVGPSANPAQPALNTESQTDRRPDTGSEDEVSEPARQRVGTINDRVAGWVYQLPTFVAERLSRDLDALLAEPDAGTS